MVEERESHIEEPVHELAEIQQLLLAGNYFRARLPTLPAFDKVGCTACNEHYCKKTASCFEP